jgi:putative endonuclease
LARVRAQGAAARVLVRGFRVRGGEIDWVAEVAQAGRVTLVFVEARARRGGGALESVDAMKRARIRAAAEAFLVRTSAGPQGAARWQAIRFDLVFGEHGVWVWFPAAWDY